MLIGADLSGSRIAFYAAVATVLPVILLALGFQLRARVVLVGHGPTANRGTRAIARMVGLALVAATGFAEVCALASLARGRDTDYSWVLVGSIVAIVILCTGTADAVLIQLSESFHKEREQAATDALDRLILERVERADTEHDAGANPGPGA